jgi:hypothetical protein
MRKLSLAKMAILSAILIVSNSCATGIHRCYEGEPRPESEIAKIHFRGFVSYTVVGTPCRIIKESRKYNSSKWNKWYIELLPGKYWISGEIDTSIGITSQNNVPCWQIVTVEAGQNYTFKAFFRVTHSKTIRIRDSEFTFPGGYPDCEFKHKPK